MNKLTPPLPLPTHIDSYTLGSLVSEDSLFFLYEARGKNGQRVLLREFCPRFYAARDEETGKLRYADDPEVREKIHGLKREFDALYGEVSFEQIAALGTVFMVQSVAVPNPPPVNTGQFPSEKKGNTFAMVVALAVIVILGAWGYKAFIAGKSDGDAPAQATDEKNAAVAEKKDSPDQIEQAQPQETSGEETSTEEAVSEPPVDSADIVIDDAEETTEITVEEVPASDVDDSEETSNEEDTAETLPDDSSEGDLPGEEPEDEAPASETLEQEDIDMDDFDMEAPEDPFASIESTDQGVFF